MKSSEHVWVKSLQKVNKDILPLTEWSNLFQSKVIFSQGYFLKLFSYVTDQCFVLLVFLKCEFNVCFLSIMILPSS